ncbi:aspartate carbamoyltransferase catalytic subunit, partial [Methylobacterium organophilum]|nr:aspartate carbamoyltransferase catalytic subunit [Methylobacterium organophilum]
MHHQGVGLGERQLLAVDISRQVEKKRTTLRGRTQINLFFEPSTRTQSSFELAGKRL